MPNYPKIIKIKHCIKNSQFILKNRLDNLLFHGDTEDNNIEDILQGIEIVKEIDLHVLQCECDICISQNYKYNR